MNATEGTVREDIEEVVREAVDDGNQLALDILATALQYPQVIAQYAKVEGFPKRGRVSVLIEVPPSPESPATL